LRVATADRLAKEAQTPELDAEQERQLERERALSRDRSRGMGR